jgi:hypothetical protein
MGHEVSLRVARSIGGEVRGVKRDVDEKLANKQQMPRGKDRKKGKRFDATGAKVATFRHADCAKEEADSQRE